MDATGPESLRGFFLPKLITRRMANATVNAIEESAEPRADPWRIAWDGLTSNELLAVVLLAMALVFALAAWLPQSPDGAGDPVAFSRWRGETQIRFGNLFALLQQVGLFSLERGPILRALIAGLALCLSLRLVESLQSAWRARHSPQPLGRAPLAILTELSFGDVAAYLRRQRFRVAAEGETVYADRFPVATAGQIATYLGALLIIAGLAISSATGWRVSNLTLGPGQLAAIGHGSPYSLRLDALDSNLTGQITLLKETDAVAQGTVAIGRPVRQGDLAVFLVGAGPAVRASATFTDGQLLRLQASAASAPAPELLFLLTQDEPDRYIGAPEAGLVVRVSRSTDNLQPLHVQVYRSNTGNIAFEGDVPSDTLVTVENASFSLRPESFAVLAITRDTGLSVTLMGAIFLALGLVTAAFWPARQLAAMADAAGTKLLGEADLVRELESGAAPITRGRRWLDAATSVGWKIGLAFLAGLMGLLAARSLMRNGAPWSSIALAWFAAAWLANCAAMLLPQRAPRWAALALTLALVMIVVSRPDLWMGPDL